MTLKFQPAKTPKDLTAILNYDLVAFSESPGFDWNISGIQGEVKNGWSVYSVVHGGEIIAALLYKIDSGQLLTKNTSLKSSSQGSGFSHKIKDFFEIKAKELGLDKIIHYCEIDNFRAYSLNESHGYEKTPRRLGRSGMVVEWVKDLRNPKKGSRGL